MKRLCKTKDCDFVAFIGPFCGKCKKLHTEKNEQAYDTKKWSALFDRCTSCERNDVKHGGFGYCKNCYKKVWMKKVDTASRKNTRHLPGRG